MAHVRHGYSINTINSVLNPSASIHRIHSHPPDPRCVCRTSHSITISRIRMHKCCCSVWQCSFLVRFFSCLCVFVCAPHVVYSTEWVCFGWRCRRRQRHVVVSVVVWGRRNVNILSESTISSTSGFGYRIIMEHVRKLLNCILDFCPYKSLSSTQLPVDNFFPDKEC